jgi:hypothetical protein
LKRTGGRLYVARTCAIELVEKLSGIRALNVLDRGFPPATPEHAATSP